jgi:hypothetical protein
LGENLDSHAVEARSDVPYVWVNEWKGGFQEMRTGLFHPTLRHGYENRKNHFGSVDRSGFPFTERVQGRLREGQVHIHPDTVSLPTCLIIRSEKLEHRTLVLEYALADHAILDSNGVDFRLSLDSAGTNLLLLRKEVSENRWQRFRYDLSAFLHRRVAFRLVVDARGSTSHDWFKVWFALVNHGSP